MQRSQVKHDFIQIFLEQAQALLASHDENALIAAKNMQLKNASIPLETKYKQAASNTHELMLMQLIGVIAEYQSMQLELTEASNGYLEKITQLDAFIHEHEKSECHLTQIICHYSRISLLILNDSQLKTETADDAIKVMAALYQARTKALTLAYQDISSITPERYAELCFGLINMVEGITIKDEIARSEVSEYAHYLVKIYIKKLLSLRHSQDEKERVIVARNKFEFMLSEEEQRQLKTIRQQISKCDALLWRLNLHENPMLREQLYSHISNYQMTAKNYINNNHRTSEMRVNSFSVLLNNTAGKDVVNEFQDTIYKLKNHVEELNRYISVLEIFSQNTIKHSMSVEEITNMKVHATFKANILLDDIALLKIQANSILQGLPEYDNINRNFTIIDTVVNALKYKINKDLAVKSIFLNQPVHDICIDDINDQSWAAVLGGLMQLQFLLHLENAGSNGNKRKIILKEGVVYLKKLMDKPGLTAAVNVFIKDYCYCLMANCLNAEEIDIINTNNFKEAVLKLKAAKCNMDIYQTLYAVTSKTVMFIKGIPTGLEIYGIDKKLAIAQVKKCEIEKIEHCVNELSISGFTLQSYLIMCSQLGNYFAKPEKEQKDFDNLYSKYSEKLFLEVKRFVIDLELNESRYRRQASPAAMQVGNALVEKDSDIDFKVNYPTKETFLVGFFTLADLIQQAQNEADLNDISQKMNVIKSEHENISLAFSDIAVHSSSGKYKKLIDLFETEKKFLTMIEFILLRKKITLGIEVPKDQCLNMANHLSFFAEDKKAHEQGSSFEFILELYLFLTAKVMALNDQYANVLDLAEAKQYIIKADEIIEVIFALKFYIEQRVRYQYYQHLAYDFHKDLLAGLNAVTSEKVEMTSSAQRYLANQFENMTNKLLAVRNVIEEAVNVHPAIVKSVPNDFQLNYDLFELRYALVSCDASLLKLNLNQHSAMRTRLKNHLKNHGLKNDFLDGRWMHSADRIFKINGLMNLDADKKPPFDQIKIGCELILKYVITFKLFYSLINTATDGEYNQFPDILAMLKFQMKSIISDSGHLMIAGIAASLDNTVIIEGVRKNMLGHLAATSILELVHGEQAQNLFPDTIDTNEYSTYDISIKYIECTGSSETVAWLKQAKLEDSLQASDQDDEKIIKRINAIKDFVVIISEDLKSYQEISSDELHTEIKAQYLTDLFLYAFSACDTPDEAACLLAGNLKSDIFALPVPGFNRFVRDYIFSHLNEKLNGEKFVDAKRTLTLSLAVSQYNAALKSAQNNPILMNSQIYRYFFQIAEQHLLVHKPDLIAALQLQKTFMIEQIKGLNQVLNPASFTYRPMQISAPVNNERQAAANDTFAVSAAKTKVKVKAVSQKKNKASSPSSKPVDTTYVTEYRKVAEMYNQDLLAIKKHYFNILKSQNFRIQANMQLRIEAINGLSQALPLIQDKQLLQSAIIELENIVADKLGKAAWSEAFSTQYQNYIKMIAECKREPKPAPVEQPKIATPNVVPIVKVARAITSRPSHFYTASHNQHSLFRQLPATISAVKTDVVLFKRSAILKRQIPQELSIFANMWKDISLPQIEISKNEFNVLTLLRNQNLTPLLQGGAVVDSIRKVPYRDIDCICFSDKAFLNDLLLAHQQALGIASVGPIFDDFIRITFESDQSSFDIAYIATKDNNKAKTLLELANNYGLGIIVFYCPFNKVIIDPCSQYTRINNNVLDMAKVFDGFDADAFFAKNPERLLACLAKDAKCRKYGKFLQANFIKEVIIRNKANLHAEHLNRTQYRFSQSLFDKLFIHGYANHTFNILYNELNILHMLFPVFSKSTTDLEFMRNAFKLATVRHQLCEDEFIRTHDFDPKKRVAMLPENHENYLRASFISDLLKPAFFSAYHAHHAHRYINAEQQQNPERFKEDVNRFLRLCSFKINAAVRAAVTENWWDEMVLSEPEQRRTLRYLTLECDSGLTTILLRRR